MKPTVVLYDIDGTVVSAGGAGRRAVQRAFQLAHDEPASFDFSFAGMTDRAIVRGILQANGRPDPAHEIDRILSIYLEVLADEVRGAEHYVVHGGITESIRALRAQPSVAVGLGTGNVERGARIKLDRAGLNEHFEFGGFGCDAEDRAELIGIGARRGAARLGLPLDACRIVVIGDTPKDVSAAHANGGECIAVATGGASLAELSATGARWVFDSLTHVDVIRLLG